MSRSLHPKQLLPIAADRSMLQSTVARFSGPGFAAPIVVGGDEHRFLLADQLAEAGCVPGAIILEPAGRNTAAAIALAAHQALAADPDATLLVVPSDHVIADAYAFRAAVATSVPAAAAAGWLVTFGNTPSAPKTGYGYIEAGAPLADVVGVEQVARFVEKPDAATAATFVAGGRHLWNGGIFLFRADRYLAELSALAPAIGNACAAAMAGATRDGAFVRPDSAAFLASPSISIDYAVMEHTDRAALVRVDMGWSDVVSWGALWGVAERDAAGNALHGDVVAIDATNCLVRVDNGPAVAVVGVSDLVVVSTRNSVLVIPRHRSQDVRAVVDEPNPDYSPDGLFGGGERSLTL